MATDDQNQPFLLKNVPETLKSLASEAAQAAQKKASEALDFSGNLDRLGQVQHLAAQGDPQAREELINNSIAMAAGTLGAGPKKLIGLEHYSNVPKLKEIDPRFKGTGFDASIKGRESAHPQSFFYREGTPAEAESAVGGSKYRYTTKMDPNSLYDIGTDPNGLVAKAIENNNGVVNMDLIHDQLKDAGFKGYYNSANERLSNVIVSYDKLPVEKTVPTSAKGLEKPHFIFTAENPIAQNFTLKGYSNKEVKEILESQGLKVENLKGKYGKEENSLIVYDVTPEQANQLHQLASDLGQESSIYSNGKKHELRFHHGENVGRSAVGEGTLFYDTPPNDFYSSLPNNVNFSHNISFDSLLESRKVKFASGGQVDTALGTLPSEYDIDKQLEQASLSAPLEQSIANSQAVNAQQAMAKPMVDSNQGSVNLINPAQELVSVPAEQLQKALESGYKEPTPEELHKYKLEAQYGGLGGAAKAFGEGAARGASFGLSSGAERLLGVSKEDIAGREEANPIASTAGELAGMVGSLATGVGEGALLAKAGAAAAKQIGGGTFIREIGQQAVRQAVEFGLMSGGEEIHRAFIEDPNQTAQSAIAHMGLSSVMGGVFGGAFGAAAKAAKAVPSPLKLLEGKFLSEADKGAVEAGDLSAIIRNSDTLHAKEKESLLASLSRKKADAPEIEAAAKSIGAPVLEGMVSDSKLIQKADDALINGPPTYSSIKRQELYNQGYKAAESAVDKALGEGSTLSKAEIGNVFKKDITSQLEAQNAPIKQMYDNLKTKFDVIPLRENAGKDVVEELSTFPELRITPNSSQGSLIKNVLNNIKNVKTVDDLKIFKSSLREGLGLASTPGEKRIAAIIGDKLTELEESSIESFAKKMAAPEEKAQVLSLIDARKAANKQYSALINKVKTLSEQLGKGKVHGIQDAIHFINEKLTPEEVTQRLFAKNNSEFMSFFQKEFPNQMSLMRDYQKGLLREAASTTGKLSPKVLFNKVNKLEPEIQKSLFAPEELAKLRDAETYLRSFPQNFNPSGTASLSAFRSFFEHPVGAGIANARDLALEKFVKLAAMSPELAGASELAKATVKGWNAMTKGAKAIFDPSSKVAVNVASNSITQRDKLKKQIDEYTVDPNRMLGINDNNPVPEYNSPFAETSMRAVNYLAMLKPRTDKFGPLDPPKTPSADAIAAYNRQLDLANNPISILNHVKNGTLIPQDMITVQTIYPALYNQIQQKLMTEIGNRTAKDQPVPYKNRMALSLFMGQPLDSTMTPEGIMGAQPAPELQQPQGPANGGKVTAKGGSAIGKMPQNFQTPLQSRDASRQKHSN